MGSHCASNCRSFWLEGLSAKLGGSLGSINKTTVISKTIYLRETLPNLRPPSNPNMDKMEKPVKHVSFHGRFTSIVGVLQATGVQFFSKLLEDLSPGSAHHQPNEVMTPTKNPPPTHPKLNRLFLLVRRGIDRKIEHCFLFIVVQRPKI